MLACLQPAWDFCRAYFGAFFREELVREDHLAICGPYGGMDGCPSTNVVGDKTIFYAPKHDARSGAVQCATEGGVWSSR